MTRSAHLAVHAAYELDLCRRHFPAMVEARQMAAEEAARTIEAWTILVELLTNGSAATTVTWAELEEFTGRALERREADLAANPDSAVKRMRRDLVAAIHEKVARNRDFIDRLNADLRARAERERIAA